jgi:hypothetical protein
MVNEEVRKIIDTGLVLLDRTTASSQRDMEVRASSLLMIVAELSQERHELENEKIKASSTERGTFANAVHKAEGKNVTEKKLWAEAKPEYVQAKEALSAVDNDVAYLKAMIDVFMNGHVMWRQFSKETS